VLLLRCLLVRWRGSGGVRLSWETRVPMRSCTTFALRESCPIANTFALSPLACRCSHSACVDDCCEGGSYTSLRLLLFAVTNGGERCCAACTGPQPTVVDDRAHCIVDGDGHTWHVACCLMHRVDSALVCVVEESAHCIVDGDGLTWHVACCLMHRVESTLICCLRQLLVLVPSELSR